MLKFCFACIHFQKGSWFLCKSTARKSGQRCWTWSVTPLGCDSVAESPSRWPVCKAQSSENHPNSTSLCAGLIPENNSPGMEKTRTVTWWQQAMKGASFEVNLICEGGSWAQLRWGAAVEENEISRVKYLLFKAGLRQEWVCQCNMLLNFNMEMSPGMYFKHTTNSDIDLTFN